MNFSRAISSNPFSMVNLSLRTIDQSDRRLPYGSIGHVLNKQGTEYGYSMSIELKNGLRHLKECPKFSKFIKFESYWFQRKGMVHFLKSLKLYGSALLF